MFGSATLDIALGLVLVFLMTSLILTSVQEAIQAFFRTRARTLEQAILDVLQGDRNLQAEFYAHPLIYALYRGRPARGTAGPPPPSRLPSYIPRETFAAALIDIMANKPADHRMQNALDGLRRVAGTDITALRSEIEAWYDGAMDRAAGAFKRRSQKSLFWLGLAVAVLLNLNAVTLAQYLTVNPQPRELVAAIAQDQLRQQAQARQSGAPPTAAAAPAAADAAAPAGPGNIMAAGGNEAAPAQPAVQPSQSAPTPISDQDVRQLTDRLFEAGLPIGWSDASVRWIERGFPGGKVAPFQGSFSWAALLAWVLLIAGYFITAFAVMLGAPFWFDVLNKIMVIRGTVKPREKSPDEASEDRGGGAGASGRSGGARGARA